MVVARRPKPRFYILAEDNLESMALNTEYTLEYLNKIYAEAVAKDSLVYFYVGEYRLAYRVVLKKFLKMGDGLDKFLQTEDAWD